MGVTCWIDFAPKIGFQDFCTTKFFLIQKIFSRIELKGGAVNTTIMPVKAIARTSIARNGVGAFVVPCHKISVQYCNWGGSSSGLRTLLKSGQLNQLAKDKKSIFFEVVKKSGHPKVSFHYNNDVVTDVNIANMNSSQILNKIDEYSQRSGDKLIKFNHKVMSINDSVRGIWSPMHTPKDHRYKI